MKKFFAILMTLALMLSLAVPAMAAEITVKNTVSGYEYVAYQIFKGDLYEADGNEVLSNITWGEDVKAETLIQKLKSTFSTNTAIQALVATTTNDTIQSTAATVAESIKGVDAALLAECIVAALDTTIGHGDELTYDSTTGYKVTGLAAGYYLVKNTTVPGTGNNTAFSDYILEVLSNEEITPKSDYPEADKKVKDTNDSDNTTSDWQDSADYDINDTVSFKLTATLPSNYTDYKQYKLTFKDTFVNFEDINITSVYLTDENGTAVAEFAISDYTPTISVNSFDVTFSNLKTSSVADKIQNGYNVVIEYTAKLADSANVGATGNNNTVKLEYSNDPNYSGDGTDEPTGTTPDDKVVVFTYTLNVDKVDQDEKPLKGAGFTLYKWVVGGVQEKNEDGSDKVGDDGKPVMVNGWVAVGKEIDGTDLTKFTWTGLDDGKYKLVETTTPAGYNTIAPIEFTITAEHDTESADPKLTSLTTTFTNATPDTTAGTITGTVQNNAGSTLPETGGMGTTIFYIVGGIMVVAAVVLLVTKKRMSAEG